MRAIRYGMILMTLAASLAGCGGTAEAPKTSEGLVPVPERPGPSQAEQKAAYLKRSKATGRPGG
jgi:hypothetical protein